MWRMSLNLGLGNLSTSMSVTRSRMLFSVMGKESARTFHTVDFENSVETVKVLNLQYDEAVRCGRRYSQSVESYEDSLIGMAAALAEFVEIFHFKDSDVCTAWKYVDRLHSTMKTNSQNIRESLQIFLDTIQVFKERERERERERSQWRNILLCRILHFVIILHVSLRISRKTTCERRWKCKKNSVER